MEKDDVKFYTSISKEEAKLITGFDKVNYITWRNPEIPCSDLLSIYAKKPIGLEFINCERPENSQTIAKAFYRVSGEESKEIEDFLIENYGMGD